MYCQAQRNSHMKKLAKSSKIWTTYGEAGCYQQKMSCEHENLVRLYLSFYKS